VAQAAKLRPGRRTHTIIPQAKKFLLKPWAELLSVPALDVAPSELKPKAARAAVVKQEGLRTQKLPPLGWFGSVYLPQRWVPPCSPHPGLEPGVERQNKCINPPLPAAVLPGVQWAAKVLRAAVCLSGLRFAWVLGWCKGHWERQ